MNMQITKAFFLQELELAVLLVTKGQRELFGLRLNHIEKINKQMLYQTVFQLMKYGILEKEEEGFKIREDIDCLMEDLITAKQFVVLASREENNPERYCYIGKSVVCIQATGQQGELLRIEIVPMEQFIDYVMGHGFCMEQILKPQGIQKQEKMEEIPDYPFSLHEYWQESKNVILQNEHISSFMIRYDLSSGKKQNQYCILSYQLDDYFICCNEENEEIYQYSEQMVKEILKGEFL